MFTVALGFYKDAFVAKLRIAVRSVLSEIWSAGRTGHRTS